MCIRDSLAAYVNQTMNDIDNLINTTLPKSVIGAYKSIIEEATAKVVTGLTTSDKAISDTVMKLSLIHIYKYSLNILRLTNKTSLTYVA